MLLHDLVTTEWEKHCRQEPAAERTHTFSLNILRKVCFSVSPSIFSALSVNPREALWWWCRVIDIRTAALRSSALVNGHTDVVVAGFYFCTLSIEYFSFMFAKKEEGSSGFTEKGGEN